MFIDINKVQIFLRPGATDMRKAINGLSAMVQDEMELNMFSDAIFLFCGKGKKILKIVYWDKNGFCLWMKRLEKEKFAWPKDESTSKKITAEELNWLLSGINFFNAHQELKMTQI